VPTVRQGGKGQQDGQARHSTAILHPGFTRPCARKDKLSFRTGQLKSPLYKPEGKDGPEREEYTPTGEGALEHFFIIITGRDLEQLRD